MLSFLAAGIISCMACTGNDAPLSDNNGSGTSAAALISKTQAYPSDYATEATHRGRVERVDYDTRDYAEGTGAARTNTAYVYLPYATMRTRHNATMSSISCTDTTAPPPPPLRLRTDCNVRCSTT